jgi:anti-sigma regulatory factor (Ser/Thr protein kinase)
MCTRPVMPQPLTRPHTLPYVQTFPGRLEQIRHARAHLARFLRDCPAVEDAILLTSELATNAVAYSATGQPGGTFTVRASLFGPRHIYVEVEDQGSAWDGNITGAEPPHGLYLLQGLSTANGTRRGEQGWIAWFTIAAPALSAQELQQ